MLKIIYDHLFFSKTLIIGIYLYLYKNYRFCRNNILTIFRDYKFFLLNNKFVLNFLLKKIFYYLIMTFTIGLNKSKIIYSNIDFYEKINF